ncbi:MAG TPA: carbonic anhydrase [Solirubrobacteraceae bacterium]|jgi:carbonic anhydrase|nr:carbonic anhydrase [Solirubrobacteraceae bacterium]
MTSSSPLSPEPTRRLAIVTCMDCRIDLHAALGLELGQAHVLRNAGGTVTDDVIRSLAISQRKLGTREVLVIHHTGCGMQGINEDGFRAELQADAGVAPPWSLEGFDDLEEDVRQSVRRVRQSPFLPHRGQVRGYILDVNTQGLREVDLSEDADE